MKATWENTVLAESDKTIVIEGNHYFPPDSLKKESRCCLVLPGTEGSC
jgi:uncharacterized protein (DUF427 family)